LDPGGSKFFIILFLGLITFLLEGLWIPSIHLSHDLPLDVDHGTKEMVVRPLLGVIASYSLYAFDVWLKVQLPKGLFHFRDETMEPFFTNRALDFPWPSPFNLLYCFIGVVIGTLIGVLPGIGPAGAIAMLLPVSYRMEPVSAIIMMAASTTAPIRGSTTSILLNIPGETSSVVTCLDGYQMARKGGPGQPWNVSFRLFYRRTLSVVGLMLSHLPGRVSLQVWPCIFLFDGFGLTMIAYLGSGFLIKSLLMGKRNFHFHHWHGPGQRHYPVYIWKHHPIRRG
jgi:hypothetical protein